MPADALISQLDRLRRTGRGKWIARCPAHDDRGPSLSVRELDDGRVLIHCFAGCPVDAVVGALGLTLSDLFPERDDHDDIGRHPGWRSAHGRDAHQRLEAIPPRTALIAITADAAEAAVLISDVAEGRLQAEAARMQLWTLAGRIASALNACEVRRG
ncbi:MAG: hypothetical protein WCY29_15785 [Novosphingobium sp.]